MNVPKLTSLFVVMNLDNREESLRIACPRLRRMTDEEMSSN